MKAHILFCFLLLFLPCALFADELNRDSIRSILEDKTITHETRAKRALDSISSIESPEERLFIYEGMILPYISKEVKDPVLNPAYTMNVHLALIRVYSQLKDVEAKVRNMEAAVRVAEESEKQMDLSLTDENTNSYNNIRANVYRINGQMHSQIGEASIGHDYLYKAIRIYESLEKYERVANCLYLIAIDFHQIGDTNGLEKVIAKMRDNANRDKANYAILYNLFATETAYYDIRLKQDSLVDYALVDSLISSCYQSINIIENHREQIATNMVPAWEYYSLASVYNSYYPNETDSIFHYLGKALGGKLDWDPVSSKEVDVSVNKLAAMVHFREGKYQQAENELLSVLKMMGEMGDRNSIQPDYLEVYRLLVKIYEQKGAYKEALNYITLLRECEKRMYDQNKINAINEMSVKYETEKRETHIQTLIKENKTAQRIIWLTLGLSVALLFAFLLIILSSRLKRKNIEQQLYETALTAELQQNELKKMIESTQEQLTQNSAQSIIEKIAELVSSSLIDKEDKRKYLARISKIDAKLLQQVYQTAEIKITNMDMKYIVCFSTDMNVKDISLLFNIEPASVHTVRYRIKKKFSKDDAARLLL